ncbi:MAG: hypothetical protein JWM68_4042 [Verrucomicrobiales bacterium]|nr:hypothetical protein [Verrucomicrobiales bacterium]
MSRLRILLLALALMALNWNVKGQTNMITMLTNGPTAKRLNIVFFSEGYTTNDLAHYVADARTMLNHMLATFPLHEYSNYFNAFAISVPSNQSGSDHYTPTTNLVDTYFNSRFDTAGIQRLVTIDSTGQSRANSLLAQFMPEYDVVALVVNDTMYGGSGGSILISSINSSSAEIATHEFGHTFASLGDEYSDAGATPSEKPNTTAQTNLVSLKWNSWIVAGTPIPTPDTPSYYSVVGLFRGAAYSTNYFRPKHNCKMRTLGAIFCEVCGEALVKTIYSKLSIIESFSPPTNITIKLTNGIANTFTITNLPPLTHSLQVQWFTNSVAVIGATSTVFTATGFDLPGSGTNLVRVDVSDLTTDVRNDPANVMKNSLVWKASGVVASPRISIVATPAQITLSWTNTATGFYLDQASTLSGLPPWTPLFLISNQTGWVISATNPQSVYRLRKP